MIRREYLLICLMEECAEVQQRVSKMLRFGPDEKEPGQELNNETRLNQELNDLYAVLELINECTVIAVETTHDDREAIKQKKEKIERYAEYSRELGIIK